MHSHPLPDLPHGTLDLADLERMVTRGLGSPYHPVCELICLENTHSSSGGRVLPIDYLHQVGPTPPPACPPSQLLASCPLEPVSLDHVSCDPCPWQLALLWEGRVCSQAAGMEGTTIAPV